MRELALLTGMLTAAQLDEVLHPEKLAAVSYRQNQAPRPGSSQPAAHRLASHAARIKAPAAATDDTANPPVASETTPASAGPTICPTPNAPVIAAITRRGSPDASSLPRIKPRAVSPMNVPPTSTAARQMPDG